MDLLKTMGLSSSLHIPSKNRAIRTSRLTFWPSRWAYEDLYQFGFETEAAARSRRRCTLAYIEESDAATTKQVYA
jgi:hypothetical protein